MQFICRNHPLVVNVSTFWLGEYDEWMNHFYDNLSYHSGLDKFRNSAMAISWQNRSLPAHGREVLSIIVKWRNQPASRPILLIDDLPSSVSTNDSLSVRGQVNVSNDESVHVAAVLDCDYGHVVEIGVVPHGVFEAVLLLSHFAAEPGHHNLTFHAVSAGGKFCKISRSFQLSVFRDAQPSPSPSPLPVPTSANSPAPTPNINHRKRELHARSFHLWDAMDLTGGCLSYTREDFARLMSECEVALRQIQNMDAADYWEVGPSPGRNRTLTEWITPCIKLLPKTVAYETDMGDYNRFYGKYKEVQRELANLDQGNGSAGSRSNCDAYPRVCN
jgi:hypothetical protein